MKGQKKEIQKHWFQDHVYVSSLFLGDQSLLYLRELQPVAQLWCLRE